MKARKLYVFRRKRKPFEALSGLLFLIYYTDTLQA